MIHSPDTRNFLEEHALLTTKLFFHGLTREVYEEVEEGYCGDMDFKLIRPNDRAIMLQAFGAREKHKSEEKTEAVWRN